MSLEGLTQHELLQRLVAATERTATANEQLIDLAQREQEESPLHPHCPHCGKVDPTISSTGGEGLMTEFVLVAKCECGETFFALPTGWVPFTDQDEVRKAMA